MEPYIELSRLVNLERLYKRELSYSLKATPDEADALAQRFGIVRINKFEAEYHVEASRTAYKGYYLTARIQAEVIQNCIVTLKEVPEKIDCEFNFHVIDQRYNQESFDDQNIQEDIEFSSEDVVDLGEISAQYLSLFLNPYPRSIDVCDQKMEDSEDLSSKKTNPFSVLKALKS